MIDIFNSHLAIINFSYWLGPIDCAYFYFVLDVVDLMTSGTAEIVKLEGNINLQSTLDP